MSRKPDAALLCLIAITLGGLWLRWSLNGEWRLGPDEALYAAWARRVASGSDAWLAATPGVDKPPLHIYLMALSMQVYGFYEFAARFPSIIASTLCIPLTFILARGLYGRRDAALPATLLIALSPFAILYAATAYPDPLMVMWLLLAAALAQSRHWGAAGLAAAAAVLTKQEAPLLLPVIILLALPGHRAAQLGRGVVVFTIIAVVAAAGGEGLWEAARPGQASPFVLGLQHYGGIGLAPIGEWPARLWRWWSEALRYVFVSPLLNGLFLAGAPLLGVRAVMGWRAGRATDAADLALLATLVYLLLARTLVGFQLWDRYLLVAAPFMCVALGRILDGLRSHVGERVEGRAAGLAGTMPALRRRGASVLVELLLTAGLLLAPVRAALAGRIAVGADHGQYWGIDQTALFVRENVPPGSVIFHSALGWQFEWYLYGARVAFWWYPSVDWLARAAAGRAEHSQYIVLPAWEDQAQLDQALSGRRLRLALVHSARRPDGSISFVTYRIAGGAE